MVVLPQELQKHSIHLKSLQHTAAGEMTQHEQVWAAKRSIEKRAIERAREESLPLRPETYGEVRFSEPDNALVENPEFAGNEVETVLRGG